MSDDDLAKRIETARSGGESAADQRVSFGRGLTLASEFVWAIVVGTGLGWMVDHFTAVPVPLGMMAGTFFGFVAGVTLMVRHVVRSARSQQN